MFDERCGRDEYACNCIAGAAADIMGLHSITVFVTVIGLSGMILCLSPADSEFEEIRGGQGNLQRARSWQRVGFGMNSGCVPLRVEIVDIIAKSNCRERPPWDVGPVRDT